MSIFKKILLLSLLLLLSGMMFGVYVKFYPVVRYQPDGTKLEIYASGDEFYNWLHDKNGFTLKRNSHGWYVYLKRAGSELEFTELKVGQSDPASTGLTPWVIIPPEKILERRQRWQNQINTLPNSRTPTTGTLNNIVIFIRFSDQSEYTEAITNYSFKFNGITGNTMQSYYLEASYSQLNIITSYYPLPSATVISWQDSHPRAYYSPYDASLNPIGYQGGDEGSERTDREFTLLQNAVNGVSSQIPTDLVVDGDGDGLVDNVCFIIQGDSDDWAELLWPHMWSIYDRNVYINNKRVYNFNFQLSVFMASRGVGVLCHEMFHSLGAPDLYHYSHDGFSTVGSWDLMESDQNPPQHMGAFMKYKYGHWISSLPELIYNGTYTLNPLTSSSGQCYKMASPNSTTEYFVVEFRKKTGTFESSIPGSGMLIYRINTLAGDGNADGPPDEVYLYRPGGSPTANGTVSSAYFSSESGRTTFNNTTYPYCFLSNGALGGLSISGIGSSAGSTISFNYNSGLAPGMPICQITAPVSGTGFALNSIINITATASDQDGTIVSIAFYIDDVWKYTDTTSPFSWDWNTTGYSAGEHIIKAVATDNSSNTGQSTILIVILGTPDEGFESGNFSTYPWVNNSAVPWLVQSSEKRTGNYAARSGAIGNNTSTTISLSLTIATSGYISFWQKVSSEANYDFLTFYIDSISQGAWSGSGNWTYQSYPVSGGQHTFTWTYSKDQAATGGSDCAWLDHIIFPPQGIYYAPPQNLSAVAGNSVINLSWQAPASGTPTGYKIYKRGTFLTTVSGLNYTDNAVVNGVSYSYYLKAVYDGSESEPSNTVTASPAIFVNIGTGTSSTGTYDGCPINVWYQSLHGQAIYTKAELNAQGIYGPINLTQLGFNITGLPSLAMPNYVIRLKHTTASNVSNWIDNTNMTTVWSSDSYKPTATGWNVLILNTPFTWNGTDNILIDTAFGLIGSYTSTGTVQYTSLSNGYRFVRSDTADETNVFTSGSTSSYRPNVTMGFAQLVTTLDTPVVDISTSQGGIILSWNAVPNATDYKIYFASDPYGSFSLLTTTSNLSYEINNLQQTGFYYVKAVYSVRKKD
ncbi:MAG TPA: M6 family metalloprotease domain-containing protein [Candidatus Cloacimonadota bacterium]|nr:M6 family metalloprotease domain-containing protein [Candidatus Cloacimonadota bacterium]HQL14921.1 M6 family metalloprotease domain-containing protein [Candidatus Cloacimonadota bacterium]